MRTKIIAANWKMYKTADEAASFMQSLVVEPFTSNIQVLIFPSFTSLASMQPWVSAQANLSVGAQNFHWAKEGAFTGEVSLTMLQALGIKQVLVGHSERREYFGESSEILKNKTDAALQNGFQIMFCCGEKWEDRKKGIHFEKVKNQILDIFDAKNQYNWSNISIAYEPVWAIGTGETASPEQAQEMHAFIRLVLSENYGEAAKNIPILYGGSVKPGNAEGLFSQSDIDGALIGGASLVLSDFVSILKTAQTVF